MSNTENESHLIHAEDVDFFEKAQIMVGSSGNTVDTVYFSADDAKENIGNHEKLSFFDGAGQKLGSIKIEHWLDNEYRVRM